ncbi:hypothetical protein V2J09_000002 [Rumex salicifolius]
MLKTGFAMLNNSDSDVSYCNMEDGLFPVITPEGSPQPFIPFLAPSPLMPFTNGSIPKLSGICPLNFTASETMMSLTSTDCLSTFAKYLANVVCCPQLEATLLILVGQSSKSTNMLALNETIAKHCLSDIEQLLVSNGANDNLHQICHVKPTNLSEGSCPVKDVDQFENMVDTSMLLVACKKIDVVNECCTQVCENAILESSQKIASKAVVINSGSQNSTIVEDCRRIVLRWLCSRLHVSDAKVLLRGLSNCKINKVCPLTFPGTSFLTNNCSHGIRSQKDCCSAMKAYVTQLQNQSFTTNLQALNCAASLGTRLRGENVTENIYNLCHVTLKDFSVQESGCLLQSLPSDVTFDQYSGISFLCDLNDNIAAPWPSAYQLPSSSCNKTIRLPALPAAASGEYGIHAEKFRHHILIALVTVLLFLQ